MKIVTAPSLWKLLRRLLFQSPQQHRSSTSSPHEQGLVYGKLDDSDVLELRRCLCHNSHVVANLMATIGPQLSDHGAKQLADVIGKSNLSSLVLTSGKQDNSSTLQTVYQGIQTSKTLRQLKIRLVGDSSRVILDLSKLPSSLQSLRLFFPDGAMSGDGSSETRILRSLSQGVAHAASLNSLELGNLNWGDDNDTKSMELLSGGLTTNASLTSLSLQGKIRDAHLAYFIEHGWRTDAALQHLALDSIYITIVGLRKLLDATLNHPALQSLTLNLMFRSQQELFDAMQMLGSMLPQLCLHQLCVDLSLCGDGISPPLPEEIQNDKFYDLIGHVQKNRNLSQFRVSGWNMHQPQQPMFDLRFGL